MKKLKLFFVFMCFLTVCVLSSSYAETKVCTLGDHEGFYNFFYDENGDLWILTSDRLLQYTNDGTLNKIFDNTEQFSIIFYYNSELIGVNRNNQILVYSNGSWVERAHSALGDKETCFGAGFTVHDNELVYTIGSDIDYHDVQVRITVVWNMETNDVNEYYNIFSLNGCTWDDERQAYVGLKKYYSNEKSDDDYQWYVVSWIPGNEPEKLFEVEFTSSSWTYCNHEWYILYNSSSGRSMARVAEDGTVTPLPNIPMLSSMTYMSDGRVVGLDNHDVVIYQIQ